EGDDFEIGRVLLEIIEENEKLENIREIIVKKNSDDVVIFENVTDDYGISKEIHCSNVILTLVQ
ncbi:MAG: hypothetical protein K6G11_10205, partial [Lachnospiraceae bacterium]|nr:hypothetical protein [Lachnospiraceae bacterium]